MEVHGTRYILLYLTSFLCATMYFGCSKPTINKAELVLSGYQTHLTPALIAAENLYNSFQFQNASLLYDSIQLHSEDNFERSFAQLRKNYQTTFNLEHTNNNDTGLSSEMSQDETLGLLQEITKISKTKKALNFSRSDSIYFSYNKANPSESLLDVEWWLEKGKYYRYVERNLDSVEHYLYLCYDLLTTLEKKPAIYPFVMVELAHFTTTKRQSKRGVYFMNLAMDQNLYDSPIPTHLHWHLKRKYAYMLWRMNLDEGNVSLEILASCYEYFKHNDLAKEAQLSLRYACIISSVYKNSSQFSKFFKLLGKEVHNEKIDYANLAYLQGNDLYNHAEYLDAIPLLEKGMEFRSKLKPIDPLYMDAVVGRLVDAYLRSGQKQAAIDTRLKTIKYSKYTNEILKKDWFAGIDKLDFYDLMVLAEAYMGKAKDALSSSLMDTALILTYECDKQFQNNVEVKEEDSILDYYNYKTRIFGNGMNAVYFLIKYTKDRKLKNDFFYFSQRSRAEYLERTKQFAVGKPEYELQNLEREIKQISEFETYSKKMQRLVMLERALQVRKKNPNIPKIRTVNELVQSKKHAYLIYNCVGNTTFIQIISNGLHTIDTLSINELDIKNYKDLVTSKNSQLQTIDKLSRKLSLQLGIHNLPQSEILVIQPDNFLNNFPFASITQDNTTGSKHLIDNYDIIYNYSLSSEALSKKIEIDFSKSIGFSFSDHALIQNDLLLPQLPYSVKELEFLGGLGAKTLFKVSKRDFIREIKKQYPYVHIAMHGHGNSRQLNKTCLYFPSKTAEIDTLYSYEIPINLEKTHCVFLSGCETNQGYFSGGEGLFSLTQAFLIRKTSFVISSFWTVEDQSAYSISKSFNRSLNNGDNIVTAFNSAIRTIRAKKSHPSHWASFGIFY